MELQSKLTAIGLAAACAASVSCSKKNAGGAAQHKAPAAKASAAAAPKPSAAAPRVAASAAPRQKWKEYDAKAYGFWMLVPVGTKFKDKTFKGGWAGLTAKVGGVTLIAAVEKGVKASRADIEKFGVEVTGIRGKSWTHIAEGQKVRGWVWYDTVKAASHNKMTIGDYGVGKKASYLVLLVTTPADYAKYASDYTRWYNSIQVD